MRFLAPVGAVLVAAASPPLFAAPRTPAELQVRGEKLAKDGQYLDAIAAFKEADAQEPTAERECLIALAYSRRNLYPQAELFLARCHARAHASPLPSWLPPIEHTITERLAGDMFAPVVIVVRHGDGARVSVSAFAPDETFEPRTIYLPPGHYVVTATQGEVTREKTVEIVDRTPRRVVIDLAPPTGPSESQEQPEPEPEQEQATTSPSHLGRNIALVGGGVAVVGAIVHLTWYRSELDELNAAQSPPDPARYYAAVDSYKASRITTISLYGAGAITLAVGLFLIATHHDPADVIVSATQVDGGGLVSLGWSR